MSERNGKIIRDLVSYRVGTVMYLDTENLHNTNYYRDNESSD